MTNDFMYKEVFLVNFMCLNSIDLLLSTLISLNYSICQICPSCFKNESRENEYCKHGKRNISLNAARGINFSTLLHLLQDKLLLFFTSGHLCNVEVFYLSKNATMSITIDYYIILQ